MDATKGTRRVLRARLRDSVGWKGRDREGVKMRVEVEWEIDLKLTTSTFTFTRPRRVSPRVTCGGAVSKATLNNCHIRRRNQRDGQLLTNK